MAEFNQKEVIYMATRALFEPGQLVELRIMKHRKRNGTAAGWFDNHELLADAIIAESGHSEAVYYTFNKIDPDLKARGYNRLVNFAPACTADADVIWRRWLLIDADPQRLKGISATSEERTEARDLMRDTLSFLEVKGFPNSLAGTSGNGYHALLKIDLPNDRQTAELIHKFLVSLDQELGNDRAKIDTKVFNAARITKAYGSLAAKGDNLPERPHRYSRLSRIPEQIGTTDLALLQSIVAAAKIEATRSSSIPQLPTPGPERDKPRGNSKITSSRLEAFLEHYAVEHYGAETYQTGTRWRLKECLFNPEHTGGDAAVFLFPEGPRYTCFHDSCAPNHWTQFRARLEADSNALKFYLVDAAPINISASTIEPVRGDDGGREDHLLAKLRTPSQAPRMEADADGGAESHLHLAPMRFTTMIDKEFEAIRFRIDSLRLVGKGADKVPAHIREEHILKTLWNDLLERGSILQDGFQGYLFLNESKSLMTIDACPEFQNLLTQYGFYPTDKLQGKVIATMSNWALAWGRKSTVHRFSFFDEKSHAAYLHLGDGRLARITSEVIEEVANGTDGVLFLNPAQQPFNVDFASLPNCAHGLKVTDGSLLSSTLNGNFDGSTGSLSSTDQHQLYVAKFLSLLFPQMFEAKPLVMIKGEHRSGKSTLVAKVGWILEGEQFTPMILADDSKDVEAALTNRFFVALDNVDDAKKASSKQDLIAVAATGGSITRRKLYTTNQEISYPITAHVYITSRVPPFSRPDVADRLLIFSCSQFDVDGEQQALSERAIKKSVLDLRNEIMAEMVVRVQLILQALNAERGNDYHSSFRVKDFSTFCLKLAHHEGWLEEMRAIFDGVNQGQSQFSASGNSIIELFRLYVGAHAEERSWSATATDLCGDLGSLAERAELEFICKGNPGFLSRKIGEYKTEFSQQFGMKVREDRKNHRMIYDFSPSIEALNSCSSEACRYLHFFAELCVCGSIC